MEQTAKAGQRLLSHDECLALLRTKYVGRVGYIDGDRPVVVPVNYRVDEVGAVLFLTAEGHKLDAAAEGRKLCLETDDSDHLSKSGWSVLVTGTASVVPQPAAAALAQELRLRAWARDVSRTQLVRIAPDLVEGRRLGSG